MALSYSDYLKIEQLLGLQKPLAEKEHDETLFIIIHQVYELWFKQILHESKMLRRSFEENQTHQVLATLKRVLCIMKTMVAQIDILETMTPLSFMSFRDRLENASGFQSLQFRELEFALGKRSPDSLRHIPDGNPQRKYLEKCLKEPSVYDSFLKFLNLNGYSIPKATLERNLLLAYEGSPEVQKTLLEVYRKDPLLGQVCERLVDLDEGIQEWRYRHVKMVERTIGTKQRTGGSLGASYLKTTLFKPLFPDLWAVRSDF